MNTFLTFLNPAGTPPPSTQTQSTHRTCRCPVGAFTRYHPLWPTPSLWLPSQKLSSLPGPFSGQGSCITKQLPPPGPPPPRHAPRAGVQLPAPEKAPVPLRPADGSGICPPGKRAQKSVPAAGEVSPPPGRKPPPAWCLPAGRRGWLPLRWGGYI